ncbi:MAG: lipoprotein insertase outer membrane protein LolB [Thiobacillus sp.]|jgi:outer membrane lipoprotein LolB|uniref:lipoprotein insertase outer membrane protein LolB n=1 Tax=Thiobacillus sp. TaxID=924 RepID=UPI00289470EC|nr:lipoprotein insertase outer membrane protein LolB [Thiobacillus sp.]MDT3706813.1 lipoprotein insertase outer membrane protein LolB [Thiobacillus sp.]
MGRLFAVLLLTLAAGCATTTPTVPAGTVAPWPSNWTLQGRIGVQAGEQSLSGNIRWRHRTDRDELLMTSPLGQGVARIVRDAEGVVLEVPNQPARRAPDAESLTREALGYVLPVSGLLWWVQGRPDPGSDFEARHAPAGRLEQIRQNGWVIDYLQYAPDARPRKLVVARDGLEIRLVADSWLAE